MVLNFPCFSTKIPQIFHNSYQRPQCVCKCLPQLLLFLEIVLGCCFLWLIPVNQRSIAITFLHPDLNASFQVQMVQLLFWSLTYHQRTQHHLLVLFFSYFFFCVKNIDKHFRSCYENIESIKNMFQFFFIT